MYSERKSAQRRQLMKRRFVPLPESQTLSSKMRGLAELHSEETAINPEIHSA
jgi:hypothetical protein